MTDLDRLIERVTRGVHERLAAAAHPARVARDRGDGAGDAPADEADVGRGAYAVTPWSVRAVEAAALREAPTARVAAAPPHVRADLARLIDHTLLKPEATRDEIVQLCAEARAYRFASVCVNTTWVALCSALLAGSDVMVCAVVGFPLGAMAPTAKAYEAREAVRQGAREIDMVINLGALKSRDEETVFEDICRVVDAAAPARIKVILETSALDAEDKIAACVLAKLAGAAFVKTSTGFGKGGATVEDVELMRRVVGPELGVKASGGVRTADDALGMVRAGANRIGASASVAIVTGDARPAGHAASPAAGVPAIPACKATPHGQGY